MCRDANKPKITDPYFDITSNLVMSSCASPILDKGKFIGVVTVDLKLDTLQNFISSIKIGEAGTVTVVTNDGTFIASEDEKKLKNLQA